MSLQARPSCKHLRHDSRPHHESSDGAPEFRRSPARSGRHRARAGCCRRSAFGPCNKNRSNHAAVPQQSPAAALAGSPKSRRHSGRARRRSLPHPGRYRPAELSAAGCGPMAISKLRTALRFFYLLSYLLCCLLLSISAYAGDWQHMTEACKLAKETRRAPTSRIRHQVLRPHSGRPPNR